MARFGIEAQRPFPLEARFGVAPDPPIGIAKMLVDGRVLGLERNRALQLDHGLDIFLGAILDPPQAVGDKTIVGPELDRLLDHLPGTLQMDAAIDPAVAQIIENERLIRMQLERP